MRPLPEVVLFRRHTWHQWMALASTTVFIPHFYFAYQGYKVNQEWRARRGDAEAPSWTMRATNAATISAAIVLPAFAYFISSRYIVRLRLLHPQKAGIQQPIAEWQTGLLPFFRKVHTAPLRDVILLPRHHKVKPSYGSGMTTEDIVRKYPNWILTTPQKAIGWHLNLTAGTVPAANYLRTYLLR